jgi:hypothetical protein
MARLDKAEIMSGNGSAEKTPATPSEPPRKPLPVGYRQGIITAITVMLGFSLLFVRFWDFELPGVWTPSATIAAILVGVAIVFQMIALWRSLQIKDDDESEYNKTLRWFLVSTIVFLSGLAISGLSLSRWLKF